MKVSYNEVSVLVLSINRHGGVHDACKTTDHEHGYEPKGKEHGRFKTDASSPHGSDPIENLNPRRDGNKHGQNGESGSGHHSHSGGIHVVTPDGKAHEADDGSGKNNQAVSKERFA